MRSWLIWPVDSVIHNLASAFGEKLLWGHHGMSFIREETNEPPEIVFQIKNNQIVNQVTKRVETGRYWRDPHRMAS